METKVFVRRASGLVREMSQRDAFFYSLLSIGISLFWVATAPIVFPGANIPLGILLAGILAIPVYAVYAMLSSAMPRSGGDYVYQSRILHPSVGFSLVMNGFVLWSFLYVGLMGFSVAIGWNLVFNLLAAWSGIAIFHSFAQWCITNAGYIIIAMAFNVVTVLALIRGLRFYVKVQYLMMVSYVLTNLMYFILLAITPHTSFISMINGYAHSVNSTITNYYTSTINSAISKGFKLNQPFSWFATIGIIPMIWGALLWAMWATPLGGEIKKASNLKSQFIQITSAGLLSAGAMALMAWLTIRTVGYDFLASSAFNSLHGLITINIGPLGAISYMHQYPLLLLAYFCIPLFIFLNIFGVLLVWQVCINSTLSPSRIMFSMAFDRLLPSKLVAVNPKYKSPVNLILVIFIISTIWLLLIGTTYSTGFPVANMIYGIILAATIPMLFTSIAAIVFPYRQSVRAIYQASPAAKYKIGKIPLISIAGILSTILCSTIILYFLIVPGLWGIGSSGIRPILGLTAFFAIIIGCFVYYFAASFYRKRQGIEVSLAFKEIPPE